MASKLPNYLRTFRKRAYLTQREVAFLIGTASGTRISRYECFKRFPGARTLLAYQIILSAPPSELFGRVHEDIRLGIRKRARRLLSEVEAHPLTATTRQKLSKLRGLAKN